VFHFFFDLDGTLTDPAPGITACLAYAAERLGYPTPFAVELQRYIGPPLREAFADLLKTRDPAVIEDAVRFYRERFSTVGIFENAVYPGVEQSLEQLRTGGFALSVVTSKPEVYASRIVDHFGLRRFFARVYGAELSGERSTKSELIAQALESEGVAPSRACMIGDREHDMLGAAAQGVAALGVTWGYGTAEELRRAGASAVIDTLDQLVAVCRRLAGGAPRPGP
jgi:phosphoglycolate phosphatase